MKTISEKTMTVLTSDESADNQSQSVSSLVDEIGTLDLFLDKWFTDAVQAHDAKAEVLRDRSELIKELEKHQGLSELRSLTLASDESRITGPAIRCGLKPGSVVGNCEVDHLLASGGCGHVFRGRHTQLGIEVAVKVLDVGKAAGDTQMADRFLVEARALAKLRHQNIVRIYEVGEYNDLYFLIMDFIEGQDLSQFIRARGAMELDQAMKVMLQVSSALAAVHKSGVIHRDIKPGNVMIDDGGDAILMDFGLAKMGAMDEDDNHKPLTIEGAFMGTPQFVAPEQIKDAASVGPATDVYSLGLTFYQLLTGELGISGTSLLDVVDQQKSYMPPAPHTIRAEIPEAISAIVMKMISKAPSSRYPDAGAVVDALHAARGNAVGAGAGAAKPVPVVSETTAVRPRFIPYAACAMVALVVLVGGLVLALQKTPAQGGTTNTGMAAAEGMHARPRIFTVLPFSGVEDRTASMAAMEAIARKGYRVVEREQIDSILAEISLSKEKLTAADSSIQVGRLTGAQIVITGSASASGLLVRAYDVETSEILGMKQVSQADLGGQFDSFLEEICKRLSYFSVVQSSDGDIVILEHGREYGATPGMTVRILGEGGRTAALATIVEVSDKRVEAKIVSKSGVVEAGMRAEEVKE